MKINIGKYPKYYSVYVIYDLLLKIGFSETTADRICERLEDTFLSKIIVWFNQKRDRKIKIHIDEYDVWGMYDTLSMIIAPMLRILREDKNGFPIIDDEDVPDELKTGPYENYSEDMSNRVLKKWEYVLDEMIFAFTTMENNTRYGIDWEDKYYSGNHEMISVPVEYNGETLYEYVAGPNHTFKCDREGYNAEMARIQNGFRLFGKYYMNLWT